jgi:hypothetical protein
MDVRPQAAERNGVPGNGAHGYAGVTKKEGDENTEEVST